MIERVPAQSVRGFGQNGLLLTRTEMKRHPANPEGLTAEERIEHSGPLQHRSDLGGQELSSDLVLWKLRAFDNLDARALAQRRNGSH
jgi:hypothetical protein